MLRIDTQIEPAPQVDATLTLVFDQRQKSRLKADLDTGEAVGLFLTRGTVLADGDCLRAEDGRIVQVRAAPEAVSTVRAPDALTLNRLAYHLGNRHVPLQVEADCLRYLHDHVLDDMVRGLGGQVTAEQVPFHPESGAYHSHGAAHSHSHD